MVCLTIYNLYNELGPGKANKGLFNIAFDQYLKDLRDAIIADAINLNIKSSF